MPPSFDSKAGKNFLPGEMWPGKHLNALYLAGPGLSLRGAEAKKFRTRSLTFAGKPNAKIVASLV
jgi:hypothetical protein